MGEERGAANVIEDATKVDADEIMSYVNESVASYESTRHFWFLDGLPKGPTGKVLRREIVVPKRIMAG